MQNCDDPSKVFHRYHGTSIGTYALSLQSMIKQQDFTLMSYPNQNSCCKVRVPLTLNVASFKGTVDIAT